MTAISLTICISHIGLLLKTESKNGEIYLIKIDLTKYNEMEEVLNIGIIYYAIFRKF